METMNIECIRERHKRESMNNILLVGQYNMFILNLIQKFHIKKWNIYTLVSDNYVKPKNVFEQYYFDYSSDSINEVITSCKPDVILFSGAYDSSYDWDYKNIKSTTLKYISNLSNILIASSKQKIKHFIYISSQEVFEDDYIIDINEDIPVYSKSNKSIAISLGENLVSYFSKTRQMETTIARLDNLYGTPQNRNDCNDFFSKMCIDALIKGQMQVDAKKVFSMLYINDATEALFVLINSAKRNYDLYHISSMEEIREDELAKLIKTNCPYSVEVIDKSIGLKERLLLSNKRFCKEFSFEIRNSYQKTMPNIIEHINNHKKRFLNYDELIEEREKRYQVFSLFKKVIPYIESLILFVLIFIFNESLSNSTYFSGINFYLLYVLLFSIVYGRQQAIFSSLLSLVGLVFSHSIHSTNLYFLVDTDIYIKVVQIFIVGLSVGHLKDKYSKLSSEMKDEFHFLNDKLEDITSINTSNEKIKNYYTDKVFSSQESIGYIYNITSKLHQSAEGEVLFAALDTLKEIMGTKDVAIYLVSKKNYCRLTSSSSSKAASLGKTVIMDDYNMIFNELRMKQVYINRGLDSTLPMMASALYDESDEIRIVIFLWELPYENMTLYYSNLLTVVGALVYSVFVRDANYLDALAYNRYYEGTTILQQEAFKEMIDIYKRAEERAYSESCVLRITNEVKSTKELNDKLNKLLRETDLIGRLPEGDLAILLTNTNRNEANYVRERLLNGNIETIII